MSISTSQWLFLPETIIRNAMAGLCAWSERVYRKSFRHIRISSSLAYFAGGWLGDRGGSTGGMGFGFGGGIGEGGKGLGVGGGIGEGGSGSGGGAGMGFWGIGSCGSGSSGRKTRRGFA